MIRPSRPTGIAILAILELLGGILILLVGIALAAVGGSVLSSLGYGSLGGLAAVAGGVVAIFGIIGLLVGWGLWTGKGWAWWLAVILSILGVLVSIGSIAVGAFTSVVGLIIDAVILWYLFRPHVKAFFGRGGVQPAPPPAAPQPPQTTA